MTGRRDGDCLPSMDTSEPDTIKHATPPTYNSTSETNKKIQGKLTCN